MFYMALQTVWHGYLQHRRCEIPDNAFDELFSLKTICNNLTGFNLPTVKYTHRCDPQTIGLCDFIGWRKYE